MNARGQRWHSEGADREGRNYAELHVPTCSSAYPRRSRRNDCAGAGACAPVSPSYKEPSRLAPAVSAAYDQLLIAVTRPRLGRYEKITVTSVAAPIRHKGLARVKGKQGVHCLTHNHVGATACQGARNETTH